ncbi:hypothetical protein N7468_004668 [Penicillium chermesinum]|uniref:Uncharacterized protein n=1 Tax=Penicillium chermesinum TaxID=63820 RepID=A0A9W9P8R6_9EURO|nr:uncharacterized protein N7468_004668 [Penicillium chermesinum]KAJ5240049.1 hypothetical protein N7468_004668 [Penicillium chermesinum]
MGESDIRENLAGEYLAGEDLAGKFLHIRPMAGSYLTPSALWGSGCYIVDEPCLFNSISTSIHQFDGIDP